MTNDDRAVLGGSDHVAHKGVLAPEECVRRTLLNRSNVEWATWAVNHAEGCIHGCLYCYARKQKAFTDGISEGDWRRPKRVADMLTILRSELESRGHLVDRVHLSFTTDPFMYDSATGRPDPEMSAASIAAIKLINDYGIPVTTLTKGVHEVEQLVGLHQENQFGITAVSFSEEFRSRWEPGAAPVEERFEALRRLHEAGERTFVSIEPYPTPNIDPTAGDPSPLLESIRFADKVIFGRMTKVPVATAYAKSDPCFYERIASQVMAECSLRGQALYVKQGTPGHDANKVDLLSVSRSHGALGSTNADEMHAPGL